MKSTYICTALIAVGLAGCASPTPPTITAADAEAAEAEATRVSALPITSAINLPTGSATFEGKMGGGISGDIDGSILGDMSMSIQFDDNTISGSVSNINYIDEDGDPDQLLGGSLTIAGAETSGALSGTMKGTLSGVPDEAPIRGEASVNLSFDGNVVTDDSEGDSVYGTVTGSGDCDFEIYMDSGLFYGKQP